MSPVLIYHAATGQYVQCVDDWTLSDDRDDAMEFEPEEAEEILTEYKRASYERFRRHPVADWPLRIYVAGWRAVTK